MEGRDLTAPTPITRRQALLRALSAGGVTGLLIAAGFELYNVVVRGHAHEVIPGVLYRCSHPSPRQLVTLQKKYGIRTVINLCGCCDATPWYLDESRATVRLDLSQEDLPFSASRLPSVPVIRELVDVLDRSERPMLIHCHQGVDRTGMASAMALLLYTDNSLDEALHQLGPRYGHIPFGPTGNIDRFFVLYREWLAAHGTGHSRATFRHWVEQEYCPAECRGLVEILDPPGEPVVMPRGEPLAIRIRCTNQSVKPWHLRPGKNAGIHAFWQVLKPNEEPVREGQSGLFHAEILPGNAIDLTVAIPAITEPGDYRLRIDMVDEQHARFHQLGPEPLEVGLQVR